MTALLLIAGAGVRIFSTPEGDVEWEGSASDTLVVKGLAAVREGAQEELVRERIRTQPLAPGERIDPNRADALQLDRLPRVGPALANRIVEWRRDHGPFRSLADLDAVPGVGPALLETLEAHVDLPSRIAAASPGRASGSRGRSSPVDLNRATGEELESLPGIGPALAERILASREAEGPFRDVSELRRVSGIGPALLERLAPLVAVPP